MLESSYKSAYNYQLASNEGDMHAYSYLQKLIVLN